jgi:hypothetical protein
LPPGWFAFGDDVGAYDIGADDQHAHNGERSGYLKSVRPSLGFGALMQSFRADDYRGRRLKLSAFCRSRAVEGWAGLWMRVDDADGEVLSFYNMEDQPIVGTTAWKPYQVVLDLPDMAARIAFGCLLAGEGTVWCDNFKFEIVDNTTPTSTERAAVYPDHPSNLSFEEPPTRRRRNRLSHAA